MNNQQAILLFGGTFDPIHHGHLIVARQVAERLGVKKVVLIPSARPPHKHSSVVANAEHRLRMVQLAVEADALFDVCDCELRRAGVSYTLDTVRHLRDLHGPAIRLYWLIGADTIRELPNWHKLADLLNECTIVTASRPGSSADDAFRSLQSS